MPIWLLVLIAAAMLPVAHPFNSGDETIGVAEVRYRFQRTNAMRNWSENNQIASGAASGLRADIPAEGKGTRLAPFLVNFSKRLVPLGDTPVLEVLIRRLILHGIADITLTLGHLAELIKAYMQNRWELAEQITLRYVEEAEPTGTAGSLAMVEGLDDTFLCMNGGLLTNLNLHSLVQFHREHNAVLTIAFHARDVCIDLGALEFDGDHIITRYLEKPKSTHHVSMGIYVSESSVIRHIARGQYLDFPDLVMRLINNGEGVCAYPYQCRWLDSGRPDDYARAQEIFAEKRGDFDLV
jgi:NDP-sugar pyrophosphorylase family protein